MAKLKPLKTLAVSFVNALLVASTLAWNVQTALAQTAALVPNAKQQFFNANGDPLVGGSVYSYVPNTTTPKTTWIDPFEATPNANPVVLDAGGGAFIFGQGNYRQVVKDAQGNLIWDGFTAAYGSSTPSGSNGTDTAPVGTVMPYAGSAVPVNWQLAYGQALSRTTFAQLETAITISTSTGNATSTSTTISGFANTSQVPVGSPIECSCLPTGTTVASITNATTLVVSQAATATGSFSVTVFPWGNGDGVTTFNVPDLRGRTFAGADAMGGTAASRLTSAFYGASASTPAVAGGAQSRTLTQPNLPNVSPSFVATNSYTPGTINSNQANIIQGNTASNVSGGSGIFAFGTQPGSGTISITLPGYTPAGNVTSINGNVTQTAFATIQPTLTVNYIIKVAPNTTGAGGVVSLGGMFGDIVCDSTLVCAPVANVNTVGCAIATTSQRGCVIPDGSTITITSGGVISAFGSATSFTPGTTTILGATAPCFLLNSTSTTSACGALGTGVTAAMANPVNAASGLLTGAFTQNGTGAVARTWASRAQDTIDIGDFGTGASALQNAVAAAGSFGGSLVLIPSNTSGSYTTPSSVPDNVLVLDERLGTAVAGTSIASPFSLLAHNSTAKSDLHIINPAATIYSTTTIGDVLGASSAYNQQSTLSLESVNNQTGAVSSGLFSFAASGAAGAQVFGANFGAGNTAGNDASITGLELDLSNNISGGGTAAKIGLVINAFNNSISSALSLNGAFGGAFNQVIKILPAASPGHLSAGSSLLESDGQTSEPDYGIDFRSDAFGSAAIALKYAQLNSVSTNGGTLDISSNIRIPNNGFLAGLNAAGNADIPIIQLDTNNNIIIASSGNPGVTFSYINFEPATTGLNLGAGSAPWSAGYFKTLFFAGSSSGLGSLAAPAVASSYAWTLPAATTTLAGISLAQTWGALQTFATGDLAIKGGSATAGLATVSSAGVLDSCAACSLATSLTVPTLYGGISAGSSLTLQSTSNGTPSADVIVFSASEFQHKTIGGTNILDYGVTAASALTDAATTNFTGTVKVAGTTEIFPSSGSIAGTTDTQTLTNKTLTTPTINTINSAASTSLTLNVNNAAGVFQVSGTSYLFWNAIGLQPQADNAYAMGGASNRFSAVYGTQFFGGAAVAGVSCTGTPTSSFATNGGIVTHC